MSFPQGASGLGTDAQVRIGRQTDPRFDDYPTMSDYRSNFGDGPVNIESISQAKVVAGSQELADLDGKGTIGIFTEDLGDVDPADLALLRYHANLYGRYTETDNTTWKKFIFSVAGTTAFDQYLRRDFDENRGVIMRQLGVRIGGVKVSASPGNNFKAEAQVGVSRYDLFDMPTRTAGAGADFPTLQGVWGALDAEPADLDAIQAEVQAVASGVLTMRFKTDSDVDFTTSPDQDYTLGNNPIRCKGAGGGYLGTRAKPLLFSAPAGADIQAGDTFDWDPRRARWSASLPTQRSISSTQTMFILDGQEVPIEGSWDADDAWVEPGMVFKPDTAMQQGGTLARTGRLRSTINISREIVDLLLQAGIHDRSSLSLVIDGATDEEIDTGVPWAFRRIYPNLKARGSLATIGQGGQNTDESVELRAGIPTAPLVYEGDSISTAAATVIHTGPITL